MYITRHGTVVLAALICFALSCIQATVALDTDIQEGCPANAGQVQRDIQQRLFSVSTAYTLENEDDGTKSQTELDTQLLSASNLESAVKQGKLRLHVYPPVSNHTVQKLVLGSCNHQLRPQPAWRHIEKQNPDAFVWMGDIVYLDLPEMMNPKPFKMFVPPTEETFSAYYTMQQKQKDYCPAIRTKIPVFGVWDDHDMGRNDGDYTYPMKEFSQQRLLDFLDIPSKEELLKMAEQAGGYRNLSTLHRAWLGRRLQGGVYNSHVMGEPGKRVKIILLDNRFFQNSDTQDMLGEEQWRWLQRELEDAAAPYGTDAYKRGGAELVIIASGIQIIGWGKLLGEGWRNFPESRARLMNLLAKAASPYTTAGRTPPAVLLFSGDVHFAETARTFTCTIRDEKDDHLRQCTSDEIRAIMTQLGVAPEGLALKAFSKLKWGGNSTDTKEKLPNVDLRRVQITPLVDVTTSGMTHSWDELFKMVWPLTPIVEAAFPVVNRQHMTNFFYQQSTSGFGPWENPVALAATVMDAIVPTIGGDEPEPVDEQHREAQARRAPLVPALTEKDLEVLRSQGSYYTKRNYASLEITWGDRGVREAQGLSTTGATTSWVTVRIHSADSGEPVLVYPLPFEGLRGFKLPSHDAKKVPRGLIQESLNQCLKEAVDRSVAPFVLSKTIALNILFVGFVFWTIVIVFVIRRFCSRRKQVAVGATEAIKRKQQ